MSIELEKAQIMFKLARGKGNWGAKYDRLEHFKRFPNLGKAVKELANSGWILLYQKPNYKAISLNLKFKSEIIQFIEEKIPYLKGSIK
ncbi:MAG: hypothetical protein ABIB79_05295 [archaeon]